MKISKKEKCCEWIWVFLILGFTFAWMIIQPYNVSPDEQMRYDLINYIYENGVLPRGDEPLLRHEIWGISYAFNPYLSGLISALFMKGVSVFTINSTCLLIAARMTGVLCTAGTVWMGIRFSRIFFQGILRWVFIFFISLLPEVIFLGSYLNNDSLALFTSAWIICIWAYVLKEGWTWKNCIQLGIAISVCLLSYYNAYGVILCSVIFFCITILLCQEKMWDWKRLFSHGIIIFIIIALLAGWWFIRNYVIYDGDILGMKTSTITSELYALEEYKPSNRITPKNLGMSILDMFFWIPGKWNFNWVGMLFVSFIGVFGQMTVFMPSVLPKIYMVVYAVGLLAVIPQIKVLFLPSYDLISVGRKKEDKAEIITKKYRKGMPWKNERIFNQVMLLSIIIPVILCVYYAYASDFQAQGRYIMPMLFPFIYFVVKGYEKILYGWIKNEVIRKLCLILLMAFALFVAGYSYFVVFAPQYLV